MCYGSVHHICNSTRAIFMKNLQVLLEDDNKDIESLDDVKKLFYMVGSELWESKFSGLLSWIKNIYCSWVGNIKTNYIIITLDPVNNSPFSVFFM